MSYSKSLGSALTNTHMRTPNHLTSPSGMCSVCTSNCMGPCEIGLSAIRGSEAIYPFATDVYQFASEKIYPLDFSHFNINGRVFGAWGCEADSDQATFPKADTEITFGRKKKIRLKAPIILPAMAKLNWRDYFAGAALAGVLVVIGEDVVAKDTNLELEDGKVVGSPLLEEMVQSFRRHDHGYGDIILQANVDDENLGVLEYAITQLGVKSVELKFGQAAKGIQGMGRLKSIEEALHYQSMGYLIYPDPSDENIAENYKKGIGQPFEKIGKLPMWTETSLKKRVLELRRLGAEQVCFKTGPYDPKDLITILKVASLSEVDLVTFDGASGGTGNSPVKMMNEWGAPTVSLESMVYDILKQMEMKGYYLPQVAITGGFSTEDHVFKGLALGAPYIQFVGIGRAAMAAATVGKLVGESILAGDVPKAYERYGRDIESIFGDVKKLKEVVGESAVDLPPGSIGLYSYIERVTTGLQQLMALNRKFSLKHIGRDDIVALTEHASNVTDIMTYSQRIKLGIKGGIL
ncbi:glutamate synthase-related protein [Fusibacter ferrireducens]|uniref:FMN-binding glutamate synthase family protein n=1 Tax=Fusibacter ferrireducens TaxID=2785058 RepID=A0ABR9ZSH7_9FIRM|nr:glutamate synthase-related protein [Fusibacter ferrireducens]MBF4693419.1 FMN-binding glutamate synthase family protein [Fusibacter ferrireducens]